MITHAPTGTVIADRQTGLEILSLQRSAHGKVVCAEVVKVLDKGPDFERIGFVVVE